MQILCVRNSRSRLIRSIFLLVPFKEKYEGVVDYVNLLQEIAIPLVQQNLGDKKLAELKSIWQKESEPIPESASDKERYEIAFRNWLKNWESAYVFTSNRLGEGGSEKFVRAAVEENKRRMGGPAFYMYKFVRAVSPKTAFQMLMKQMTYQYQVFTPLTLSKLDGQSGVMEMSPCKIFDTQACGPFCTVGCQTAFPHLMEEHFKVKVMLEPKGKDCVGYYSKL